MMGLSYFGSGAIVVLRWGLLSFATAHFMTAIVLSLPPSLDTSAWYFGNILVFVAIVVVCGTWALYTSLGGKLWNADFIEPTARRA